MDFPPARLADLTLPAGALPGVLRRPRVSVPILSAGEGLALLSGFSLSRHCAAVSRCSVVVSGLALDGAPGASKPAAPVAMLFDLYGLCDGLWVRLAGYSWAPGEWAAPGLLSWSGPLVQGFAVRGRVPVEAGADARALLVNVCWLFDVAAVEKGAGGGPLVTVV